MFGDVCRSTSLTKPSVIWVCIRGKNMASYHFTIKSNKRRNGKSVSAHDHLKYINREGKYKNIDEQRNAYGNYPNLISGDNPIKDFLFEEKLIYESPYGNIKICLDGIRVSNGASLETVAIALNLAKKIYDSPALFLNSKRSFKAKTILAIVNYDLDLDLKDKSLNQELSFYKKEKQEYERRIKEQNSGRLYKFIRDRRNEFKWDSVEWRNGRNIETNSGRGNAKSGIGRNEETDGRNKKRSTGGRAWGNLQPGTEADTIDSIAKKRYDVYALQSSVLDSARGRSRTDVLLHQPSKHHVLKRRRKSGSKLRWKIHGRHGSRERINKTVEKIFLDLNKSNSSVLGSSHVKYINRDEAFAKRGGCLYTSHHLPSWAKDNPVNFFAMADREERKNGERYKEIEFALPNELDLEQKKELIEIFLQRHLKNFYYAYAIHDKIGTMGNGEHNPHVHIMFSTREIDKAEIENERPAKQFFARANISEPEKGGCKKAEKWTGKNRDKYLLELRADYADIQNNLLEKYGYNVRIDHRSLEERRKAALASGNFLLAEMLDRIPEKKVGPTPVIEETNPIFSQQRRLRKINQQKSSSILAKKYLAGQIKYNKTINDINDLRIAVLENNGKADKELTKKFEEIESTRNQLISFDKAVLGAKLTFMKPNEKVLYQDLLHAVNEKKYWLEFYKKELSQLNETDKEKLHQQIKNEIQKLNEKINVLSPQIHTIMERLSGPENKKYVLYEIGKILQKNYIVYERLDKLKKEFNNIKAVIGSEKENREKEISEQQPKKVKLVGDKKLKEIDALLLQLRTQRKSLKVLNSSQAVSIAQNVYLKGELKKFRTNERNLEKMKSKLSASEYAEKKEQLQTTEKLIRTKLSTDAAKKKVLEIANAILVKNAPVREQYEKVTEQISKLETVKEAIIKQHPVKNVGSSPAPLPVQNTSNGTGIDHGYVSRLGTDDEDDDELLTETERLDRKNKTR